MEQVMIKSTNNAAGDIPVATKADVLSKSDLICKVNFPEAKDLGQIKENSHLIVSNYNPEKEKQFLKNISDNIKISENPKIHEKLQNNFLSNLYKYFL